MNPSEAQQIIEAINDPEHEGNEVLRLADKLFTESDLIYIGRHNPRSDEMLQKILHTLVKKALKP